MINDLSAWCDRMFIIIFHKYTQMYTYRGVWFITKCSKKLSAWLFIAFHLWIMFNGSFINWQVKFCECITFYLQKILDILWLNWFRLSWLIFSDTTHWLKMRYDKPYLLDSCRNQNEKKCKFVWLISYINEKFHLFTFDSHEQISQLDIGIII